MNDNYYAVLIGINSYADDHLPALRFAEKDCQDFYSVITDKHLSFFPEKNVRMLTGKQATTDSIKETLYEICVHNRRPGDLVVIFYSGHGFFAGDENHAYIGSYDVDIDYLKKNPDKGLGMDFIHDRIFMGTKADRVILLFDCCFSGSFITQRNRFFSYRSGLNDDLSTRSGRFAILSSLPYEPSREEENLQNGVFTHHMIAGLRKDAADPKTGEVTLPALINHLELKMQGQISTFIQSTTGRIVLTRPGVPVEIQILKAPERIAPAKVEPVSHHLERSAEFITGLMGRFGALAPGYDANAIAKPVLESIRQASAADLACFIEESDARSWQQIVSEFELSAVTREDYFSRIQESIFAALASGEIHNRVAHGYLIAPEALVAEGKSCLIIPLAQYKCKKFLILCGVDQTQPRVQDVFAHILASFYNYTCSNYSDLSLPEDIGRIEAAIIDDLRTTYGFLPIKLYQRRFELFCHRIKSMQMWYQPIVLIDEQARYVRIESWEALARDPKTRRVPKDLMDAAEIWGPEFQIELDRNCLYKAVKNYSEITLPAKGSGEIAQDNLDLAVNVFPASLMSPAFYRMVNHVVNEDPRFPGRKLVFEISEKREIPATIDCDPSLSKYAIFQNRINDYVRDFGASFAIDDFGVGHSSVSRLANLKLSHIKLDAQISRQEHSLLTIQYVLNLVTERISSHSKVILEGMDNFGRLKHVYELGLYLIQGFAVREARPDVTPIDENIRKEIAFYLAGARKKGMNP